MSKDFRGANYLVIEGAEHILYNLLMLMMDPFSPLEFVDPVGL